MSNNYLMSGYNKTELHLFREEKFKITRIHLQRWMGGIHLAKP